eukprot:TRINITY_DN13642_c0_g1_i2.p1 TRINITY_DN13642_c0_g1~~TRINITY_DN13642_c0_g1_i2.p1  ORF type:complete len:191 (+),score=51.21 TRINITY_DN13642_c0_g1_i2:172-744(+)
MQTPNLKALELGDVTNGGKDLVGCALAVGLGVATAAAAATLSADKIGSPTPESRSTVGVAVGALMGGGVTAGCSGKSPSLSLGGMLAGALVGLLGARQLQNKEDKEDSKKKTDKGAQPPKSSSSAEPHWTQQLKDLKDLRDADVLTEHEFERQKSYIMAKTPAVKAAAKAAVACDEPKDESGGGEVGPKH